MTILSCDQIFIHGIGDYITQSDWMAQNKTKAHLPAFCHALVYSLGFLMFTPSPLAWLVIFGMHFLIDRYRLARYIVWAKNFLGPRGGNPSFSDCAATGYPPSTPAWLSVWLMIIADNILHVAINGAALKFL